MKKNHLFIKKCNSNSFKRSFAYRKLFLGIFILASVICISAMSGYSFDGSEGMLKCGGGASLAILTPFAIPVKKSEETPEQFAERSISRSEEHTSELQSRY